MVPPLIGGVLLGELVLVLMVKVLFKFTEGGESVRGSPLFIVPGVGRMGFPSGVLRGLGLTPPVCPREGTVRPRRLSLARMF